MKSVFLLMFLVFTAFSSEKNSSWCKCSDKKLETIDVPEKYQDNRTIEERAIDYKRQREFLDAVQKGHTEIVKFLATQNVDLNRDNENGETPVYVASGKGHTEIVEFLAAQKVDLNQADIYGETPIFVAAMENRIEIVKFLAAENVYLNQSTDYAETPVYIAAKLGHKEIIEFLADKVDLNRADKWGRTPFHVAAKGGHKEIVKFLIESNVRLEENLISIAKTEEIKNMISKRLKRFKK